MTTCVGYLDEDGGSWLGADQLAIMYGDRKHQEARCKIVVAGPWAIAVAGPAVIWQALQSRQEAVGEIESGPAVGDFIWNLVREFNWKPHEPEGSPPTYNVEALVVRAGELWHLMEDGLMLQQERFAAIGSGADFALGALAGLEDNAGLVAGSIPLQIALTAAARFDPFTGEMHDIVAAPSWAPPVEPAPGPAPGSRVLRPRAAFREGGP